MYIFFKSVDIVFCCSLRCRNKGESILNIMFSWIDFGADTLELLCIFDYLAYFNVNTV